MYYVMQDKGIFLNGSETNSHISPLTPPSSSAHPRYPARIPHSQITSAEYYDALKMCETDTGIHLPITDL
jgi:hypothetical protein